MRKIGMGAARTRTATRGRQLAATALSLLLAFMMMPGAALATESSTKTIDIAIVGTDADGNAQLWARQSYSYPATSNVTAETVTKSLLSDSGLKFTDSTSKYGWSLDSVTSPDGTITLQYDPETYKWLQLFKNNESSARGASKTILQEGDTVQWYYSAYGDPAADLGTLGGFTTLKDSLYSTLFSNIAASYKGTGDCWEAMDLAAIGNGASVDTAALAKQALTEYNAPDYTNLQKAVIALSANGIDATAVPTGSGTADLVAKMAANEMAYQYLNGEIFALLAYESGGYAVPSGALRTKDALIADILAAQLDDGGFAFFGSSADSDMTAMTISALAPYYGSNSQVRAAIDKAVTTLKSLQNTDGGFGTNYTTNAAESNANSTAVVVMALCSVGINPAGADWSADSGSAPMQALLTFGNTAQNAFQYSGADNDSATEQGFRALVSYKKLKETGTAYNIYLQGAKLVKPSIKLSKTAETLKGTKSATVKVTVGSKVDSVKSVAITTTAGKKAILLKTSDAKKTIKVTGKRIGAKKKTAQVKVTLASGKTATLKVTVTPVKTTMIKVAKKKITLKKGKKKTIKASVKPTNSTQEITYRSSSKKIATVSSKGVVKAKKKGTAKITVKSGKKKAVVTVKVK